MWSEFTKNNFKFLTKSLFSSNSLVDELKKIRTNIIKLPDVEYTIKEINISNNKLVELTSSPWVIPNLNYNYLTYEVNITWNNNDNLYIKTTKNKFDKFKKRLPIFLKIINFIKDDNININIYLILTNLTKYLELNKVISPKHINTGYTNIITNEIFLWREEEFEKVTFHELIHLFSKDHMDESIELSVEIDGPESFYEAITDFKGILFNVIYLSLITRKKIQSILNYEYSFIYNQAKKINHYLNTCKKNTTIIQKSPAYSYFILKYFIFKYFLENPFNYELFKNIFYESNNYNTLIKLIKNYKINDSHFYDFNSARMTLFELK
jgi:hypothetical protein